MLTGAIRRGGLRIAIAGVVGLLVAVSFGRTVVDDVHGARVDLRSSARSREDARGPLAEASTDLPLVLAAARRIPPRATYAVLRGGRWGTDAQPALALSFAWETGLSWMQYALAPRRQVASGRADWLLIRDATPAGLHARHRWRYGSDWLVQLR